MCNLYHDILSEALSPHSQKWPLFSHFTDDGTAFQKNEIIFTETH